MTLPKFPHEIPFSKRQFIAVLDTLGDAEPGKPSVDYAWVYNMAANIGVAAVKHFAGPVTSLATLAATELLRAPLLEKFSSRQPIALPVLFADAEKLTLPIGHPRTNLVYAAHPGNPNIYYPLAEFHNHTFEHKFTELMKILRRLGAKQIIARSEEKDEGTASSRFSFDVFKAEAGGKSKKARNIDWSAEYPDTGVDPDLPQSLSWYHWEPTWQEAAEARMESRVRRFTLKLAYTNDFGVTAELSTKFEKYGLDIGGEFNKQRNSILDVDVEFWD